MMFPYLPSTSEGQDKIVLELTNFKKNGFFIELGADDGYWLSNTFYLEKKYNWNGICIEANPMKKLKFKRRCVYCNYCIYNKHTNIDFNLTRGGIEDYLTKKEGNFSYKNLHTVPIDYILKKYQAPFIIDFLSLDTEGTELLILKSFPFDDYFIRIISVEHNFNKIYRKSLYNFLESLGYSKVAEVNVNDIYFKSF